MIRGRARRRTEGFNGLSGVIAALLCLSAAALAACGHVRTRPTETPIPPSPVPTIQRPTLAPTWTPLPEAPLPTWTPAPTPTPIIYTVQPGDNLIGIAKRFGISATLLQTANGIMDPRRLQIGQELLIPPEEPNAGPALPTPTPVAVRVENTTVYEVPSGGYWMLGSVANPNAEPVERVVVEVTLLDADGATVAAEQAATLLEIIQPGESAAFAALFRSVPKPFATYRVSVLSADILQHLGHLYLDFSIPSHAMRESGGGSVEVSGEVRNEGASIAAPFVVITAYDSNGRIVAVREVESEPPILGPGERGAFSGILASLRGAIVRYTVEAQGERLGE
jgi:LysM repeat protein